MVICTLEPSQHLRYQGWQGDIGSPLTPGRQSTYNARHPRSLGKMAGDLDKSRPLTESRPGLEAPFPHVK